MGVGGEMAAILPAVPVLGGGGPGVFRGGPWFPEKAVSTTICGLSFIETA